MSNDDETAQSLRAKLSQGYAVNGQCHIAPFVCVCVCVCVVNHLMYGGLSFVRREGNVLLVEVT